MTDIIQRSPEWFAIRLGKVTASRIADVTAKTKSGPSASRANYRAQLVLERLLGEVQPSYTSAAMQNGTDTEPEARAAYEFLTNAEVQEIGFVPHPTIGMAGCSPDGLGEDGLVEIKCPIPATHMDTLMGASIDGKYTKQMQWQMACTGRKWCDFVSYNNAMPSAMRLFIKRVPRDPILIAELEKEVITFLSEVDRTVAELRARYETQQAETPLLMAG